MLYILIFFYAWVYQLDIYLVTAFFLFNVEMFNIEKKYLFAVHIPYYSILVKTVIEVSFNVSDFCEEKHLL